jgi:hypothetical protein
MPSTLFYLINFLKKIGQFIQPLLIISLMDFFEPCSTMSIQFACLLAGLYVLNALFSSFSLHRVSIICIYIFEYLIYTYQFLYEIQIFSMQMRVAYHGLIFRKVRMNISIYVHIIVTYVFIGSSSIESFVEYIQFR